MKLLRISLVLGVLLILTISVASADSPNGPNRVGRAEFLEGEEYQGCWIFDVNFDWYPIDDCSPTIALITHKEISTTNMMNNMNAKQNKTTWLIDRSSGFSTI